MNKLTSALLVTATALMGALPLTAQPSAMKVASSGGISPHETISAVIGGRNGSRVTITYGRPFSKDPKTGAIRKIWGTLVPWEKAYRLGSDEATLFISEQAIEIGGVTIPGGVAYTLYFVPSENGASKLAFSTRIGKWGIPVDETHDLARVEVKKDAMDKQIDQLTLAVEGDKTTGGGVIRIMWETTQYSVPFTIKK
jgi:hypothetical protein